MIFSLIAWPLMVALCVAVVLFYIQRMQHFKCLKKLPGTPPTFLIGNITWIINLYRKSKELQFHPGVCKYIFCFYFLFHLKIHLKTKILKLQVVLHLSKRTHYLKNLQSQSSFILNNHSLGL